MIYISHLTNCMNTTWYHENHHPILLWLWCPLGSHWKHGRDNNALQCSLNYFNCHQCWNFKLDCQPWQYEIQHAVKQKAQSKDKFSTIAISKKSTQVLSQDISNCKAAKDQTLFFWIPLKVTVTRVVTMALKCISDKWEWRYFYTFYLMFCLVYEESSSTLYARFHRSVIKIGWKTKKEGFNQKISVKWNKSKNDMRWSKSQPDSLLTLVTGDMVYHADNSHIQKHSVKKG